MLVLLIILLLLFGGGGFGYRRWGTGGGLGVVGTVLAIILVLWFMGAIR